jgi:hypothetical protein
MKSKAFFRASFRDKSTSVPDSRRFKSYLEPVLAELKTAGIEALFVSDSGPNERGFI